MANSHSFPLLRLPNKVPTQVLRCMCEFHILLISLISRKTKNLVKSLQLKHYEFNITIDHKLTLKIYPITLEFYKSPDEKMKMLEKPSKILVTFKDNKGKYIEVSDVENPLAVKDWFCHLCYIFNLRVATQMTITTGSEEVDVNVIQYSFPKIRRLRILHLSPPHSKNILELFYRDIEEVKITSNPFNEGDPLYKRLLVQNYHTLKLGINGGWENFTLNDLLICNATDIDYNTRQNFVGINRFLKLWIKGCNPRLNKLRIYQRAPKDEDILDGIKISRRVPEEEDVVHTRRTLRRRDFPVEFTAVEIQRYDGTKGTVVMFPNSTSLLVDDN